ncbi:MAG: hypothetical protein ACOC7R_00150 [Planctomycetota bacterium]
MTLHLCAGCHRPTPAYYLTIQGLCDDCKWMTWIPRGYVRREAYKLDPVWGHLNATRRPPMGVGFLDQRARLVSDVLPMCARRPNVQSWRRSTFSPTADHNKS